MLQVPYLHRGTTCAIRAIRALKALRADRAPRGFQLHEEVPFHGALRPGDPLIKLLELRFVSLSSETSRSFQTSQSSQSSITSHPSFPDVELHQFFIFLLCVNCTVVV